MKKQSSGFIFNIDDKPPVILNLLYGFQWALLFFPALLMVTTLCAEAFQLTTSEKVTFLQLTFLTAGCFTILQSLIGHRYPVLEGPSTAHLLTMLSFAPYGLGSVQGGMICGSLFMISIGFFGKLELLKKVFTRNIVIVILFLIALVLVPTLVRSILKAPEMAEGKKGSLLAFSFFIIFFTAFCGYHLKGFAGSFSLLFGIVTGTCLYPLIGDINFSLWTLFPWLKYPALWRPFNPDFSIVSVVSFVIAYGAVMVNVMGSLTGIAAVTDKARLPNSLKKTAVINGISGAVSGFLGIVGLVSYSISPGVVVMQRVASRYVMVGCGLLIALMGLVPKLAALFALIPSVVVYSILCVAMGSQIGAALNMVTSNTFEMRDGMVIGLSIFMGIMVSLLPEDVIVGVHLLENLFLKNGLISGILIALILEHGLLRSKRGS